MTTDRYASTRTRTNSDRYVDACALAALACAVVSFAATSLIAIAAAVRMLRRVLH